ncbi:MAG: FHA domain-containing protein [Anaerolineales bacterium]|jgi:pSer/pThr/pTyr-binding forkhead associated (FHA) protein
MSPGLLLLILRILMGVALFGFLTFVLIVLRQDLRQQSTQSASIPRARLLVESQSSEGDFYPLSNINLIGRAADNTIVVQDEVVSAHHARLTYLSGWQWWLEDLGSRNGTRVNGISIEQPLAVTHGDEITFGTVVSKLDVEGAGSDMSSKEMFDQENNDL